MKRAVFATICLFCIVVWPAAAQISPDLVAMAPAGEVAPNICFTPRNKHAIIIYYY